MEGQILVFPEPCTRPQGDPCRRCQAICPAGAISFANDDATPVIGHDACTRCGICIGICDAFASGTVTTVDHAKRMERKAKSHGGELYLCCREDVFEGLEPAANVEVLNCLSSLSPEFIAYLLSCGISVSLCHDTSYCGDCAMGGSYGGRLWQRAVQLAQEWTCGRVATVSQIPEVEHLSDRFAEADRRELLTGIADAAAEVASGDYRARKSTAVEDFLARRERMRAQVAAPRQDALYLSDAAREANRKSRFARKILMEQTRKNLEAQTDA